MAYNRETVVAEKFQAMVYLGMANSRMKDFLDVWTLARTFAFDGQLLSAAIAATFQRRKTDLPADSPLALSAEFADDRTKQTQWAAFLRKGSRDAGSLGLKAVLTEIGNFLLPNATICWQSPHSTGPFGRHGFVGTQVNGGSDLTANHIIQNALLIGGAAGRPALLTIDASDALGNPLVQPSGLALFGSPTPSTPFGAGGIGFANLNSDGSSELASLSPSSSVGSGYPSSIPEPSTVLLVLTAITGLVGQRFAQRCRARRNYD